MEDKVLTFIKDNEIFKYGDGVIVGVSGGPDSVALVYFLHSIKLHLGLRLAVCHVNHLLRGVESNEDEVFVEHLCQELGIGYYSKKVDVQKLSGERGTSIEETGRVERYAFFYSVKDNLGMDKIALGHHKDDNVETIFMRFLRGTGIKGLRGIAVKRRDGVVRPFLCVTKKEILHYCKSNGIVSRLDKTNLERVHHRNKLRLEVIPYMETLNPNFSNNVENLGEICNGYYDFVQNHVKDAFEVVVDRGKINIVKFNRLHQVLKTEILREVLNRFHKENSVEYQHIKILLNKLQEEQDTTWSIDLPNGTKMIRQYDYLFPEYKDGLDVVEDYNYGLISDKTYVFTKIGITMKIEILSVEEYKDSDKTAAVACFDYEKIMGKGNRLHLRSRKKGDRIEPVGLNGTKKIKEIFIDKKISVRKRWKIPILCIDNEVIWVVGYHRSRKFIVSEDTKKIMKVSCFYHEEASK